MAVLWHVTVMASLAALLVASQVTVADYVAGHGAHASDATNLPAKRAQTAQSQTSHLAVPKSAGIPNKLYESGNAVHGKEGLDSIRHIFGESAGFDYPLDSEFSNVIYPVESADPIDSGYSSTNSKGSEIYILPDGEKFHTPPPLHEDYRESNSEIHFNVDASAQKSESHNFELGSSIPKIVNKPESAAVYSKAQFQNPDNLTPSDKLESDYTLNKDETALYHDIVKTFNGSPSQAAGASPEARAPLSSGYGAPQVVAPLSSGYGAPQVVAPLSSGYGAPQVGSEISSGYSQIPVNSYTSVPSADEVEEVPYSGFLSTLWKTGSVRDATTGYAGDLWSRFTKTIGTKVAKKSKLLLAKAAPLVKKGAGAKAVASFFQDDGKKASATKSVIVNKIPAVGAKLPAIDSVGESVNQVVAESKLPVLDSAIKSTTLELVSHDSPKPSYSAPSQDSISAYGAPPVLPATQYGAPPSVSSGIFVETSSNKPVTPEIYPIPQYVPPTAQLHSAAASEYYQPTLQDQQATHSSYVPPQASHLIRNQGGEHSDTTTPRSGIFAILARAREGYNAVSDTFEYGRNLTNQATGALGALWPGNWFSSGGSRPSESPSAPAAVTIVSSYAAPVAAPVLPAASHQYYSPSYPYLASDVTSDETEVQGYPVQYEVPQYTHSGNVLKNEQAGHQYPVPVQNGGPKPPVALSYVATLSGPVVQAQN